MDKLAAADIDADMTVLLAAAAEENEIAFLHVAVADFRAAVDLLGMRKGVADLFEHILGEATAVKAGRRFAAPNIWNADVLFGDFYQLFSLGAGFR